MPDSTEFDVTQLEEIDATRVDGVQSPANGTGWILMKALGPGNGANDLATPTQKDTPLAENATKTSGDKPEKTDPKPDGAEVVKQDGETPKPDVSEIVKSAVAEAMKAHEAAVAVIKADNTELRDEIAKLRETPIPGGPHFTSPGTRKGADTRLAKAAELERKADLPNLDRDLASHYRTEAKALRAEAE